ncbi:hypothetical protein DQ04_01231110 [Trypanosoma grayi]|uniref:hypothetical protein n=1 Tax=Trypanosoma grayi TaxID=71804 RepID=UPI0004F43F1E|nr:hypothetical protein DQ04_01231110 [Trypanosoma grayi]KEG13076.1 hypothetical protein DQ04_01231110 [Trypanosoma grayi]
MVVLMSLRNIAYTMYGVYQRHQVLRANPKAVIEPFKKHRAFVYAGLRMADMFGHINNARYLEIFELARWHHAGYAGLATTLREANASFVVASANVQYVREMPPCRRYLVTVQLLQFEGTDATAAGGGAARSPATSGGDAPPRDGRMVIMQEIWSADEKTLYAGVLLRAALVGDARSPLALPSSGKQRSRYAPLSCSGVFATATGPAAARAAAEENTQDFYTRLGFTRCQEGTKGESWIDITRDVEKEWRSKLRSVKFP